MVGVTGGKAQGFMALTSHVDLSVLHKCFALDAYDRLVKTDEQTGTPACVAPATPSVFPSGAASLLTRGRSCLL